MRIISRKAVFNHHPFSGRGASLYVGVGTDPNGVVFRRLRALSPRWIRGTGFPAGDGVRKGAFVAQVTDAEQTLSVPLDPAWAEETIHMQVRTFATNVENITNYRPQRIGFDDELEPDTELHCSGNILAANKLDGGHYRIRFAIVTALTGVRPVQFRIVKTSGPTSVADAVIVPSTFGGVVQRDFSAVVPAEGLSGLQDGGEYTFALVAENGAVTKTLDTHTFTADNAGPPAPTSLRAEVI